MTKLPAHAQTFRRHSASKVKQEQYRKEDEAKAVEEIAARKKEREALRQDLKEKDLSAGGDRAWTPQSGAEPKAMPEPVPADEAADLKPASSKKKAKKKSLAERVDDVLVEDGALD